MAFYLIETAFVVCKDTKVFLIECCGLFSPFKGGDEVVEVFFELVDDDTT